MNKINSNNFIPKIPDINEYRELTENKSCDNASTPNNKRECENILKNIMRGIKHVIRL